MVLLDLLFPKFCLGCKLSGTYICPSCIKKLLPIKKQTCFYCQKPSPFGLTHQKCLKKWGIDGVTALFFYSNLLKKIIKNLKYNLAIAVWKEFTQALLPAHLQPLLFFKDQFEALYIQPLPLHRQKLKERGFNQAEILTNFFNQFLNLPIINYLERKKETIPQAQLKTKKERFLNIKGAFKVSKTTDVANKSIILVDDVLTTGYTLSEATKVLKKAGAKKVYLLVIARG
jgi:ComF family protein